MNIQIVLSTLNRINRGGFLEPFLYYDNGGPLMEIPNDWAGIYMWMDPMGIQYIGKSKSLKSRIATYPKGGNKILAEAFRFYGPEEMQCYILEVCSRGAITKKESEYIRHYGTLFPDGYNLQVEHSRDFGTSANRSDLETFQEYLVNNRKKTSSTLYSQLFSNFFLPDFLYKKYVESITLSYVTTAEKQTKSKHTDECYEFEELFMKS